MLWWGGHDLGLFGTRETVQLFRSVDPTKSNVSLPPRWEEAARSIHPSEQFSYSWKTIGNFKNSTWNNKPLKTESFPVLQAGRNVREIQLKAQPTKVCTFSALSAPGQAQHREVLEKSLPQLLIRGWLGLGGFWCNWTGQTIEFLSIHCIKITHPTI